MTTDNRYNGWTNYETWNVALWLYNDQGSEEYWNEQAQTVWDQAETDESCSRSLNALYALQQDMEAQIDDGREEYGITQLPGTYGDLLQHALNQVNWHEIAETYLTEVDGYQANPKS